MSSHSSHHWRTSTHPYRQDPQQSTSTLASSTGETKKTFLGRWKSVFRKEAMEMLPEQDSPMSSFLQTSHITCLLALPPHPESNYPTAADLARYLIRLGLGTAGPAGSPATEQPTSGRPRDTPIRPVPNDPHYIYVSSTTELDLVWDNPQYSPHCLLSPVGRPKLRSHRRVPSRHILGWTRTNHHAISHSHGAEQRANNRAPITVGPKKARYSKKEKGASEIRHWGRRRAQPGWSRQKAGRAWEGGGIQKSPWRTSRAEDPRNW